MYSNIVKRNDGSIKIDTGFGPLQMIVGKDGRVEIIVESKRVAVTSIALLRKFIEAFDSSNNLLETEKVIKDHFGKLEMMVLENIKPEFRESSCRFIDTGKADEAFLKYMDEDKNCRRTISAVLEEQGEKVREFVRTFSVCYSRFYNDIG